MSTNQPRTDQALLNEIGARIARARLDRNVSQAGLAREAGVSTRTLARLEAGESIQLVNFLRILRAADLLAELDSMTREPAPRPLQQLRSQTKTRKRASSSSSSSSSPSNPSTPPQPSDPSIQKADAADTANPDWTWGDENDAHSDDNPNPKGGGA